MFHKLQAILALSLFLSLASSVMAQDEGYGPAVPPKVDPASHPAYTVDTTEYDWGACMQGDLVKHVFKVTNTGKAPLRITKVKPGCGCTTKRFDPLVAVGETGEVELTIDTTKLRGGKVRKYATIFTNDPRNAQPKVFMGGSITAIVVSDPVNLRLSGLYQDELTASVQIKPGSDLAFELESVKSQNNRIEIIDTVRLGDTYTISLRAPGTDRPSMARDTLLLNVKTPDGTVRKSQVPIIVEHKDRITILPRGNVVFQKRQTAQLRVNDEKPIFRDVTLVGGSDEIRFKVLGAELVDLPAETFSTEVREVKANSRYKVRVFLHRYRPERSVRGKLRITTDDPLNPVKEMSIFAQFGDRAGSSSPRVKPRFKPRAGQPKTPGANAKKRADAGKSNKPPVKNKSGN